MSTIGPHTIAFAVRQVQSKFKHAADFGVRGPYSQEQALTFEQALRAHVEQQATRAIPGTYRGEPVTHFVDPETGLNVMRDDHGAFVSGWRLTPAQLANVLTRGRL